MRLKGHIYTVDEIVNNMDFANGDYPEDVLIICIYKLIDEISRLHNTANELRSENTDIILQNDRVCRIITMLIKDKLSKEDMIKIYKEKLDEVTRYG